MDYVAIDRVFSNLLENVTRHTPPGTRITISAVEKGEQVVITVSDTGPGIPETQVPHLFDRFYRGQTARPDARRGTGLGLAVVKGLVEAHGGIAKVVSQVGAGSSVMFTLPLGPRREEVAECEPELAGVER
jgi:signal transduction histidine kinase